MQRLSFKNKYINISDVIPNVSGMTISTLKVQLLYWFKHSRINQKCKQNVKT